MLPGISSQIHYLPSNPCLRSASEKTATYSEKTILGFYQTTGHFFTFLALAGQALGEAGDGRPHLHPQCESYNLSHTSHVFGEVSFYSWKDLRAWTNAVNIASPNKEMNTLPAYPPLTCETRPTPVSLLTLGSPGEHIAVLIHSDWIALEHIARPFTQRRRGKGTLILTWSRIMSWPILIPCYYYWDGKFFFKLFGIVSIYQWY